VLTTLALTVNVEFGSTMIVGSGSAFDAHCLNFSVIERSPNTNTIITMPAPTNVRN
jgi:hypothetical protein